MQNSPCIALAQYLLKLRLNLKNIAINVNVTTHRLSKTKTIVHKYSVNYSIDILKETLWILPVTTGIASSLKSLHELLVFYVTTEEY